MAQPIRNIMINEIAEIDTFYNGGKGSGNFGHKGRPGEVGGSGDGMGVSVSDKEESPKFRRGSKETEWEMAKGYKTRYCDDRTLSNFEEEFDEIGDDEEAFEAFSSVIDTAPMMLIDEVLGGLNQPVGHGTIGRSAPRGSSISRQATGDYIIATMMRYADRGEKISYENPKHKRAFDLFKDVVKSSPDTYFDAQDVMGIDGKLFTIRGKK